MIKMNFDKASFDKYVKEQFEKFQDQIITHLQYLGEQTVNNARQQIGMDPSAFPIKYGSVKNKKPLRQRKITQRDTDKSGGTPKTPKFGDYLDNTANLRNSIGYVVFKDGRIIRNGLGSQGKGNAQQLVKSVIIKYPKGYGLIVVAGMEYAELVEAKGYNVITSQRQFVREEMPKILKRLKLK